MFYIDKDVNGNYIFHLKSDEKHSIASSRAYPDISEIETDINYIVKNTNLDRIYERKTTKNGQFYFNILDQALQTSATSQFYNSRAGLENGIKAAKEFAKQHQIKKIF